MWAQVQVLCSNTHLLSRYQLLSITPTSEAIFQQVRKGAA
jgi:hypothetical protein